MIDDEDGALAAIADLEAAGMAPDGIWRLSGPELAEVVRAQETGQTALQRMTGALSSLLSDDARILDYLEMTGSSGQILIIQAEERRDEIQATLARHGAHDMRYFGRLTTEDLY